MVHCARCTPEDLLAILRGIEPGITMAKTRESVQEAISKLATDCMDWDCSAETINKQYPEFCRLKLTLEQSILYLDQGVRPRVCAFFTQKKYIIFMSFVFVFLLMCVSASDFPSENCLWLCSIFTLLRLSPLSPLSPLSDVWHGVLYHV